MVANQVNTTSPSEAQMETKYNGAVTRAAAAKFRPDGSNIKTPPGPPSTPMPHEAALRHEAVLRSKEYRQSQTTHGKNRRRPSPVDMPNLEI